MANKRMFSKQITTSDAFLDMPVSSQLLYFHLNMEADDDGFVGNPKRIMRMLNVADDDLKILLAKRFLLAFKSGVVVIKHWLLHNAVRKDMYQETQYLDEKKGLKIKENKVYTEIRNDSVTKPLHRLDKDRLDKDRLDIHQSPKIEFSKFWELYPKKVEKKKSEEKWNRLELDTQKVILEDLPKRIQGSQWKEQGGKFVPNPLTYLNGARWEDEIKVEKLKVTEHLKA